MTATDADDPVYGNSAKLVYSILEGQPYFSVEPHTGKCFRMSTDFHMWYGGGECFPNAVLCPAFKHNV